MGQPWQAGADLRRLSNYIPESETLQVQFGSCSVVTCGFIADILDSDLSTAIYYLHNSGKII